MNTEYIWNDTVEQHEKIRSTLCLIRNLFKGINVASLGRKKIENIQLKSLKIMTDYAKTNSSYWKDILDGLELKCFEDIQKIPYTRKSDILEYHNKPLVQQLEAGIHPTEIKTPMMTIPLAGCNIYRTSGSTGEPSLLTCLPGELADWSSLMGEKMKMWFKPEDRVINLYPPAGGWAAFEVTVRELNSVGVMALHLGNKESFEVILEEFKKYRFNCVSAAPTWFSTFLSWLESTGNADAISPIEKFFSGAEPPTSFVEYKGRKIKIREYLTHKWNAILLSEYTGTETGLIGLPLSEQAALENCFHIIDDAGIVEILPEGDKLAKENRMGEAIVTSFSYLTTPFFRFKSGDAIRLLPESLENVGRRLVSFCEDSRVDDCILIAGRNITGTAKICDSLTEKYNVTFQIVLKKDSNSEYDLSLELRTDTPLMTSQKSEAENDLRNSLCRLVYLDGGIDNVIKNIPIKFHENLIIGSTGKFKQVINKR